jgi:hypothetical protein
MTLTDYQTHFLAEVAKAGNWDEEACTEQEWQALLQLRAAGLVETFMLDDRPHWRTTDTADTADTGA